VLAVHHGELAGQSADVDEEVEVVVHARGRGRRVDNDTLSAGQRSDHHPLEVELLDNQGVDVGLEAAGANTHEDDTDGEGGQRPVGVRDNGRQAGDDEDDVANDVDQESNGDGPVAAEIAVGKPGAKQRHGVLPERVKRGQARCSPLAEAKGASLAILDVVTGTRGRVLGTLLLDEVCEDGGRAVVREALAQLDEGNRVDVPGNPVRYTPESVHLLLGGRSTIDSEAELVVLLIRHDGGGHGDLLVLDSGVDIVADSDAGWV
jgi:hypothetical protein